jgi:hypothetical protein
MKRVTPTRSTTRSNILFTKDGVRASMVTRYWPWVLGWHESVVGTLMSPELLDVGPAEAVPDVVLVPTCSVVRSVPGPPVPWVGNVGLGCVVGDMTSTSGLRLVARAGTVLADGSLVCTWVVVGSRVAFEGLSADLPAVLCTGWSVVSWTVVPCIWAPEVGMGFLLDVSVGVLLAGLGVLV